jgi:hypothetical protein
MLGKAGFRKALRLERGVDRSMMYPIASIAECMEKGPTMWGQRGFCEEEKVREMLIQHRNDVDQGRVVDPRLLNIYGQEFEFDGRLGGGCRLVGCRAPSS